MNAAGETVRELTYYPFGLVNAELSSADTTGYDFLFTGKEWIDDLGIDLYDYGARYLDPELGRWGAVDPMAEKEHNLPYSPYNYCINNPIRLFDPDGEDWFYNEKTGDVFYSSQLHEGAEEYMVEGWQWMGATVMFSFDGEFVDVYELLDRNKDLTLFGVNTQVSYYDNMRISTHTMAYFEGKNAKLFMNRMGYSFVMKTYMYHKDISTEYHPDTHGQITLPGPDNSKIINVLSYQYVPSHYRLRNSIILENYDVPLTTFKSFGPMYIVRDQSWTIQEDRYSKHSFGRKAGDCFDMVLDNTPWKTAVIIFVKKLLRNK